MLTATKIQIRFYVNSNKNIQNSKILCYCAKLISINISKQQYPYHQDIKIQQSSYQINQNIAKPINIEKKNKSPSKQTQSLTKVSMFQQLWQIDVVEDVRFGEVMWQQTEVWHGNAVANEGPPRFVAGDRGGR